MSAIQVIGQTPLKGEIWIQGSKNAVLPMMAAALLHRGITVLSHVPSIRDAACMTDILRYLGAGCRREGDSIVIDASHVTGTRIPRQHVTAMRSSIVVLSALLGRMGEAASSYPGGCLIGSRPIDLHLMVLRSLGAEIVEEEGLITAKADREGLWGTMIELPYPSVGATEQAILASVLARDATVLLGAAREPEIDQLCRFLNNMGADISGMGTGRLVITGVRELHDSRFAVEGDRIVAGTYGAAVAAAGGEVILKGLRPRDLELPMRMLEKAGASVRTEEESGQIEVRMDRRPGPLDIKTGPHPEFPTDLQSPFMAFLAGGQGVSTIEERVFEGRFATVKALEKMGACIRTEDRKAVIQGRFPLTGATVHASDLRGGAALVVAALAARGETFIWDCLHIERGYEDICRDFGSLGAQIGWVEH